MLLWEEEQNHEIVQNWYQENECMCFIPRRTFLFSTVKLKVATLDESLYKPLSIVF